MKDKISIVIPCYNTEEYMERCLQSIESQTYGIDRMEIILVNDSSTDRTCDYLLSFEEKYPDNVMVVNCETHCGPGTARNIGMEYAAGKHLTFIDADDIADQTMIEKMYQAVKKYNCQMVECNYMQFTDTNKLQ